MVPVHRAPLRVSLLCAAAATLALAACGGGDDAPAPAPGAAAGAAISAANAGNFAAEALSAAIALEFASAKAENRNPIVIDPIVVELGVARPGAVRPLAVAEANVDLIVTVNDVTENVKATLLVDSDLTDPARSVFTVTSDLITAERRIGGVLRATRSLSQVQLQDTLTVATGDVSANASWAVVGSFPVLGQVAFQVQTPVPLVIPGDQAAPVSGAVKVIGEGNTSVTATLEGDNVRLQVDIDGDGTADVEETRSLAAIEALL